MQSFRLKHALYGVPHVASLSDQTHEVQSVIEAEFFVYTPKLLVRFSAAELMCMAGSSIATQDRPSVQMLCSSPEFVALDQCDDVSTAVRKATDEISSLATASRPGGENSCKYREAFQTLVREYLAARRKLNPDQIDIAIVPLRSGRYVFDRLEALSEEGYAASFVEVETKRFASQAVVALSPIRLQRNVSKFRPSTVAIVDAGLVTGLTASAILAANSDLLQSCSLVVVFSVFASLYGCVATMDVAKRLGINLRIEVCSLVFAINRDFRAVRDKSGSGCIQLTTGDVGEWLWSRVNEESE